MFMGSSYFFVAFIYCLLPLLLTAWNRRQFTILPADGTFDSIAPRPLFSTNITTVILDTSICVWVSMRVLWVPTLTSIATNCYWGCPRIPAYIYGITCVLIWKKHVPFEFSWERRNYFYSVSCEYCHKSIISISSFVTDFGMTKVWI